MITVAAELANGGAVSSRISVKGEPRGPLCGMGICFECAVTVNGEPHVRSCQLLAKPGMLVETETGETHSLIGTQRIRPIVEEPRNFDIVIAGAGPAGIAAAIAARQGGASVGMVDDNPTAGGQIWRGESNQALRQFISSGVQLLTETRIVDAPEPGVLQTEHFQLGYKKLILATGVRELFLPFPGWTLPNVMGAGGLQAMVKGGLNIDGKRVVIAGSGPLLIAVADSLLKRGAKVVAIVEQASFSNVAMFGLQLTRHLSKAMQATRLMWQLRKVPVYWGRYPVQAEGNGKLERVILNGGRTLTCDYLACGFGLTPNTELAALLGCQLSDEFVKVDDQQSTSMQNVFAAGELTGIGGVDKSMVEGSIAGFAASGDFRRAEALYNERDSLRPFQSALKTRFALRSELFQLAQSSTIICRCEDVTLGQLEDHSSWREAKLHTRCGMGSCQGRVCGPALALLKGWTNDGVRPPLSPVKATAWLK